MKKYLFIVLLVGVCFGQIVPDTLVMTSGKTFPGFYDRKDDTYTYFKHQNSTRVDRIFNSVIQEVRISDKKVKIVSNKNDKASKVSKDNKQFGGGGLGFGGRIGFNFFGEFDGYYDLKKQKRNRVFVGAGTTSTGERSEDNTYDFNEDLFGDGKLGKQTESTFIVGGLVDRVGELSIYYGGGFTISSKFFKRDDDTEILGSEGIYFVEDDDGDVWKLTGTFGVMLDNSLDSWNVSKTGIIVNINPLFINFVVLW